MMSFFQKHSRKIFVAMLLPMAFGCQPTGPLNDLELSERMTKGTTDRVGVITLTNGKVIQGFFLAIRGDSLEWHEGMTLMTHQHAIAVDSVESVIAHGPQPYWAPIFGLSGCALGGCAAGCIECTNEVSTTETVTSKTAVATVAGAAVGAAAGYGIGLLTDPGKAENSWMYKIRKSSR